MPFLGLGVGRQRFRDSGGGFDSDYQAVLNYATTQGYTLPSSGQQTLQNQLIVDLKDAGVWTKLDSFGVFATDGDSDFALIDWVRLTDYTAVNSPTFTTNQGFQGNATSSYIDANYVATTDGVNYTLYSSGFGYYMRQYDTAPSSSEGAMRLDGTNGISWIRYTAKRLYLNSSFGGYSNFVAQSNQLAAANRTPGTNMNLYSNGVLQDSVSEATVGLPNNTTFLLTTGSNYSNCELSMVYIGGDLTAEQSDLYTAFYTNYLSNL